MKILEKNSCNRCLETRVKMPEVASVPRLKNGSCLVCLEHTVIQTETETEKGVSLGFTHRGSQGLKWLRRPVTDKLSERDCGSCQPSGSKEREHVTVQS